MMTNCMYQSSPHALACIVALTSCTTSRPFSSLLVAAVVSVVSAGAKSKKGKSAPPVETTPKLVHTSKPSTSVAVATSKVANAVSKKPISARRK
jgi:hypothetical protein